MNCYICGRELSTLICGRELSTLMRYRGRDGLKIVICCKNHPGVDKGNDVDLDQDGEGSVPGSVPGEVSLRSQTKGGIEID